MSLPLSLRRETPGFFHRWNAQRISKDQQTSLVCVWTNVQHGCVNNVDIWHPVDAEAGKEILLEIEFWKSLGFRARPQVQ